MHDKKLLFLPLAFTLVLVPVFVAALISYQPNPNRQDCSTAGSADGEVHLHEAGTDLVAEVKDDLQLLLNIGPAEQLYQVVDGSLQVCGLPPGDRDLKHIALSVNDARIALGERLPVSVELTLRQHDTGDLVVEAGAPAMIAYDYGYHYGDNFRVPSGASYDWTVKVSPVAALRQEGTQDVWLTPVEWSGSFTLDADGNVTSPQAALRPIGEITQSGVTVKLSYQDPLPLYDVSGGETTRQDYLPGSRYFVVTVTDQAIWIGEKLPGAAVQLTFRQGTTVQEVTLPPVISPIYGFHYGANVVLAPGKWQITLLIEHLDFLRHASAAIRLPQKPVSTTFEFTF